MARALAVLVAVSAYMPTTWRPAVRKGVSVRSRGGAPLVAPMVALLAAVGDGEEGKEPVAEEPVAEEPAAEEPAAEEAAAEEEKEETPAETPEEEKEEDLTESLAFLQKKKQMIEKDMADVEDQIKFQRSRLDDSDDWAMRVETLKDDLVRMKQRAQHEAVVPTQLGEVLSVVFYGTDNFDRCIEYTRASNDEEQEVYDKYTALKDLLDKIYTDMGLEVIGDLGVAFDPYIHNAAVYQPHPHYPRDTVAGFLEKGYRLRGTMIRPATVLVSSGQEETF